MLIYSANKLDNGELVKKGYGWVYDPQSGGTKISENNKWLFRQQAEKCAKDRPGSSEYELIVRFKSQFCYLDVLKKGESRPFPIGRLRYFRDNVWSLAFFTRRLHHCFPIP